MSLEGPNQGAPNPIEGKLNYAGGDFVYTPGSETDPDKVLAAAKQVVEERGGFDQLGRGRLFVSIPGKGEFNFDENSTVESLLATREQQETLKSMMSNLTLAQPEQAIEFIKKLQEPKV